ncbi:MAG: hypothetical protein ABI211_02255, partial [Vicinamibacterales bacterium]
MSLRLRLIVAFFFLSVVPLAAVTLYTYASSAAALREAAGHEAQSLAGDLSQRMQLVTAQISERVEHVMDAQREADARAAAPPRTAVIERPRPATGTGAATPAKPVPVASAESTREDSVAAALGEVAMLLNNIEVRGLRPPGPPPGPPPSGPPPPGDSRGGQGRGFRGGGGGDRGGDRSRRGEIVLGTPVPAPSVSATGASPIPAPALASAPSVAPLLPVSPLTPGVPDSAAAAAAEGRGRRQGPDFDRSASPDRPFGGIRPDFGAGRGGLPPAPGLPAIPGAPDPEADRDRIQFDMMPIRREMIQQLVGSGEEWQKLSQEDRQRVISEVNQRMLGIVQGIQMGAAELQKKVSEAQKVADEKSRA